MDKWKRELDKWTGEENRYKHEAAYHDGKKKLAIEKKLNCVMYKEGMDEGMAKMAVRNAAKLKYEGLFATYNQKYQEWDGYRRNKIHWH